MEAVKVSKTAVRRWLLDKQGLLGPAFRGGTRPSDVLRTIQNLECVQLDPVAAVSQNQHLVLATRLSAYKPKVLEGLLEAGQVFEYWANAACVIPINDYPLFKSIRQRRMDRLQSELAALGPIGTHVLHRLTNEGPLPSKAFASEERVHGYWDNTHPKTKASSHALNLLHDMGLIQVVRREGTTRYFNLRERAVPASILAEEEYITLQDANDALLDKYLQAYRLVEPSDARFGWQHLSAAERRQAIDSRIQSGMLTPLHIDGVKRVYYILTEDVNRLMELESTSFESVSQTVHFLPPLDNLLWRRQRIEDLFDFSYTWEIYIPAAKRTYGYYTMPILVGDQLIGRIDPKLQREENRLDVRLLQVEPHIRWTKGLRTRLWKALDTFARAHHAELGPIEETIPEGLTRL